jgi:hypothetical protein
MKHEGTPGDLRRSLALRRNAPSEAPITTRPPCLCQIPSHITDDVTVDFRVGAVPSVLRWQYQRLVHGAFITSKYLSTCGCLLNDFVNFLGPTSFGNEDESSGLPSDTIYITHAVLTLPDDALSTNTPCSWTTRKVQKGIRMARAGTFACPTVSNTNGLPAE